MTDMAECFTAQVDAATADALDVVTFCGCPHPQIVDRVCMNDDCGLVNLAALLTWTASLCRCPEPDLFVMGFPARVCGTCGRSNLGALLNPRDERTFD